MSADAPEQKDDAVTLVSSIAYGFMGSQALFAALELGLFSALATGPLTAEEISARTGAHIGPLHALLHALTGLGLVLRENERYRNSKAAARYLVRESRGYMGEYYLRQIADTLYQQLPQARAVLRGEARDTTYSSFLDDPVRTELFIRGQHAGSAGPAFLLARNADFSAYRRMLDLGGGSGAFSIEIARRWPQMSAIVFDQPGVIRFAEQFVADAGLSERIDCASGDVVNDSWPEGCDLILMSYIVSSYRPEDLRALLVRAFGYLPAAGGIMIHDFAMHDEQPGPRNAALWSFANLAISATTHPHTISDIATAMSDAGFSPVDARPHIPDITFLFTGCKP
ncbi:methyltransferase [Pseudorhodoplanes sp.]|uniref:methyltransferase n=1 Tax=Pseudorhodoplanes sp. TaxID=1934341 RepID=UPI003D100593